ncbi:protein of unknown function [Pseudomonas delhiensis]|uniref:DUF3291 domain-containing protein n=1 Tax=Pseudomonas delhiensis TaxID=366289 RepID=A0A239J5J7_9PSED|nr:DUF3291 domain-containing protein [Pseudomonas delhiensis]SDJ74553.1 protein of unknown function [Pseudomonas delhiensis]SNS99924.1 protein of unknown function [Pseudomonas delhiensis]
MSQPYHLAQVNIARARAPLDHPLMRDFVDQLAPVNALAEASPGFVWRLQDEAGDATGVQAFDDPRIIVNLSLWESLEALRDYVYGGEHLAVLRRRRDWMEKLPGPSLALWWLPAGQLPSLAQARAALRSLAERGPSAEAFSIARPFPTPGMEALPA